MEAKRTKIVRVPGALPAAASVPSAQHSGLQDKLQARMAKRKSTRKMPPGYIVDQAVEVLVDGTYRKGVITGVQMTPAMAGVYDVLFPESGARESNVDEKNIRARQMTKARFEYLPLVHELRRKVQYDFYDDPVDGDLVSGYYHPDENYNKWSITAWHTRSMCFLWMEDRAYKQQYASLAAVSLFSPRPPNAIIPDRGIVMHVLLHNCSLPCIPLADQSNCCRSNAISTASLRTQ